MSWGVSSVADGQGVQKQNGRNVDGMGSVRQIGLEQGANNPGAEQQDGERCGHRVLGARSLGRLST